MTVNLTIAYHDPNKVRKHMPIAAQSTFSQCWLPASRELELKWIPLFETGYPAIELNLETIPEVMEELHRLLTFFVEHETQVNPKCVTPNIIQRIERLLAEIKGAVDEWEEVEYIHV